MPAGVQEGHSQAEGLPSACLVFPISFAFCWKGAKGSRHRGVSAIKLVPVCPAGAACDSIPAGTVPLQPLHPPGKLGEMQLASACMVCSSSSAWREQRPGLLPADKREAHPAVDRAGLPAPAGAGRLQHPCCRVRAHVVMAEGQGLVMAKGWTLQAGRAGGREGWRRDIELDLRAKV